MQTQRARISVRIDYMTTDTHNSQQITLYSACQVPKKDQCRQQTTKSPTWMMTNHRSFTVVQIPQKQLHMSTNFCTAHAYVNMAQVHDQM